MSVEHQVTPTFIQPESQLQGWMVRVSCEGEVLYAWKIILSNTETAATGTLLPAS